MQAAAALSGRWAGAAARLNATAGGAAHFARDAGVGVAPAVSQRRRLAFIAVATA